MNDEEKKAEEAVVLLTIQGNGRESSGNKKIRDRRFRIIGSLLDLPRNTLSEKHAFNDAVKKTALHYNLHPRTIKRWLKEYERTNGNVDALTPHYRGRQLSQEVSRVKDTMLEFAINVRTTNPVMTVKQLIREIEVKYPDLKGKIKRPTLQRYLQKHGCSKKIVKMDPELRSKGFYNRF